MPTPMNSGTNYLLNLGNEYPNQYQRPEGAPKGDNMNPHPKMIELWGSEEGETIYCVKSFSFGGYGGLLGEPKKRHIQYKFGEVIDPADLDYMRTNNPVPIDGFLARVASKKLFWANHFKLILLTRQIKPEPTTFELELNGQKIREMLDITKGNTALLYDYMKARQWFSSNSGGARDFVEHVGFLLEGKKLSYTIS